MSGTSMEPRPADHSIWRKRQDQPADSFHIHVIISSGSGTGLALTTWKREVHPLLDTLGFKTEDYSVHETGSEDWIKAFVQDTLHPTANGGILQSVLLLSGDGGLVDIVDTLLLCGDRTTHFKRPVITLLPCGTGNAMANSVVVTDDPENTMGLRTMLEGRPQTVPCFKVTFSSGAKQLVNEGRDTQSLSTSRDALISTYGAVVCSWGLHAEIVADSDTAEYRKHGAERFKMAAKEALFPSDGSTPHAYQGKISVIRPSNKEWQSVPRETHSYVLATLVSHLEAGFTISPSSMPLDGKLWLVHFGHVSGQEAMDIMTKAYQGGKHVEDERVGYEEIEGIKIEFDEEDARYRRVCVDGKTVQVEKGGSVEVRNVAENERVVELITRSELQN